MAPAPAKRIRPTVPQMPSISALAADNKFLASVHKQLLTRCRRDALPPRDTKAE